MFNDNPLFEFRGPWGVPVQIGGSILLLPLMFISLHGTGTDLLFDLLYLALLVGSIYLHELGHAWGCLIQGVPVRRIMVHGGGGFCERSRSTTAREDELIVSMGPIVNLTIWAVCSLVEPMLPPSYTAMILGDLAWINLFLAVLNLMPAMPLDGGKLFHIMMLRVFHPQTAMVIAGAVGLVIALAWLPLMIWCYLRLGFVLFFIPPIGLHWQMVTRRAA